MIQRPNKSPGNGNTRVSLLPRNFVTIPVVTVFWDSESVLFLEFMPHKTTIIGDTYAYTMVAKRENIKLKRRGKLSVGVLLLHDNALAHKSRTSWAAIRNRGFVELNHPPYSADLALSDPFSLETLKNFCMGDDFLMTMQSRKL